MMRAYSRFAFEELGELNRRARDHRHAVRRDPFLHVGLIEDLRRFLSKLRDHAAGVPPCTNSPYQVSSRSPAGRLVQRRQLGAIAERWFDAMAASG